LVTDALQKKAGDPTIAVPWSGFDLINTFNAWKRSEAAGRSFLAAPDGIITKQATGLVWRHEVSAQVFEEAAVDLGRALAPTNRVGLAKPKHGRSASRGANAKVAAARASDSAIRRAAAAPARSGSGTAIPAP
jgi:hypothetical protein